MSDFPDYKAAQRAQDAGRAAASIVDAALGDRLLYENIEDHPFSPANAWVEDLVDHGTLAQVWPKERRR